MVPKEEEAPESPTFSPSFDLAEPDQPPLLLDEKPPSLGSHQRIARSQPAPLSPEIVHPPVAPIAEIDFASDKPIPIARDLPSLRLVAALLRAKGESQGFCAPLRVIQSRFTPNPDQDALRAMLKSQPAVFHVDPVDVVVLKDPGLKGTISGLMKELCRKPLSKERIDPKEPGIGDHIFAAANYAMLSNPQEVANLLVHLSNHVLRAPRKVTPGKYPANMPLVLACLLDRIVYLERRQGDGSDLERALAPVVHQVVFARWTIGVVPGSQFLCNLLLAWCRLGYFGEEHLKKPRAAVWLLLCYADQGEGSPGVEDADRDAGEGWYRFVRRDGAGPRVASISPGGPVAAGPAAGVADGDRRRRRVHHAASQMQLGVEAGAKRRRLDG